MDCPHCGSEISPAAILCPCCQTVVVESQDWNPPVLDKSGIGPENKRRRSRITWGVLAANMAAVLMIGLGQWLGAKSGTGASIFISSDFTLVPLVMGLVSAFFWKDLRLTTLEYFLFSLITSGLGLLCGGMFMGEGIICLFIVSPLLLCFIFGGALLGRWLFQFDNNRLNLSLLPLALTLLTLDVFSPHHYENSVSDTVVIHAPAAQVWTHLAAVPPIPERPNFWLFQMGLPYPTQSTVMGVGVGAKRRCIFSQERVFEEQITEWQPGRKLTFDVTSQPRDPEIMGHARVERGQFELQGNRDGTTTLTGTSWYELYVYPSWYYDLWARSIARQVHLRVMTHIKTLCEQQQRQGR